MADIVVVVESGEPIVRLASWYLVEAGLPVVSLHTLEIEAIVAARPAVVVFNAPLDATARRALFVQMREHAPALKILELSPRTLPAQPPDDTGADAYLAPPFLASELVERVQALLSGAPGGA